MSNTVKSYDKLFFALSSHSVQAVYYHLFTDTKLLTDFLDLVAVVTIKNDLTFKRGTHFTVI